MSVGPIEKTRSITRVEVDEEKAPELLQYIEAKTKAGNHIIYIAIF